MKLIVLLLCLGIDYFLHITAKWREQTWFTWYVDKIKAFSNKIPLWNGPLSLVVIILPVLIALLILTGLIGLIFKAPGEAIIDAAILLFALGYSNLQLGLANYVKTADKSEEAALKELLASQKITVSHSLHRTISQLQLWQAHERLFGVIFWFVVLGPFGAVLYRLVSWLHEAAVAGDTWYDKQLNHLEIAHSILAWIPSRLTALTYALTGNFSPTFVIWKKHAFTKEPPHTVLVESGEAALDLLQDNESQASQAENQKVDQLIYRTTLVWVILVAVVTVLQFVL